MNKEIPSKEIRFSALSMVDDIGKVFFWKNRVFRAINYEAVETVKEIFSSGMIEELVENKLFPKSWITDYIIDGYRLVVEHEKIHPVTYPYEWSFSMLKDAAITVLQINLIARKYGYQTKDCHGFNVLFDGPYPKYVDLGSFIKVEPKSTGWIAYEEFLRLYFYPLRIWSNGNDYIARRMLLGPSIMPHYGYLLYRHPFYRFMNLEILKKIITLYYGFKKISLISSKVIKKRFPGYFGDLIVYLRAKRVLPFQLVRFSSLIKKIQRFSKKKHKTSWSNYHNKFYDEYGKLRSTPRFDRIISIIKEREHEIRTVLEIGGNQGVLSKLLLERTNIESVICTDYDEFAIDLSYLSSKKYNKFTTAYLDFVSPIIPARRESPAERFRSDAVLALAVTHHLILTQKRSIDFIFKTISMYSKRYVFIEFMPLGLWNGKSAKQIPPWYTTEWFKSSFKNYFNMILEEQIGDNRILFVGLAQNNQNVEKN